MFRAFFVAFWGFEAGIIWIASDGTIKFITAAVGLKHLTSVRRKTKDAPDKGDLVTSEV